MKAVMHHIAISRTLVSAAAACALLTACMTAPAKPPGAAEARNKLTLLQENSALGNLAPGAMQDAEAAVIIAEVPVSDAKLAAHRVFMADRKVATAQALSETRFSEDRRASLVEQLEKARLAARAREADIASGKSSATPAAALK